MKDRRIDGDGEADLSSSLFTIVPLSRSSSQDLDLLTLDLSFSDLPSFTPNIADPVQPNPKVVISTPDQECSSRLKCSSM
ncbi:hypothetical protein L2E82_48904 [Cichorium intybus]|uniref:Uncharacterized protein n=1 Tax=Cichorium intybus TaxID=13427 RepID=A0ACB8Z360_CICIN|nr:hypothetical protein L2E82_48904 [Cichorium intybus]